MPLTRAGSSRSHQTAPRPSAWPPCLSPSLSPADGSPEPPPTLLQICRSLSEGASAVASGRDRQGRAESRGRRRAVLAPEGERGPGATAAQGQCRGGGLAAEVGLAGWSDGQEPPAGPVPAWRPSRKGSGASATAVPLPEKSGVVSRSAGRGGLGREPRAAWRSRGVRRNVGPSPGSACSGRPLVVPWPGAAFFKNPMWFRLF